MKMNQTKRVFATFTRLLKIKQPEKRKKRLGGNDPSRRFAVRAKRNRVKVAAECRVIRFFRLGGVQRKKNPNCIKIRVLIWASAGNTVKNGALVELTFHVSDTAEGAQTVSIQADNVFDQNGKAVAISVQNAVITVPDAQPTTIGSVTADQTVDAAVYAKDGASAAICAQYDADGEFLSASMRTLAAGENSISFGVVAADAANIKVFAVVSATFAPLCSAKTAD